MGWITDWLDRSADRERATRQAYWRHIESCVERLRPETAAQLHSLVGHTTPDLKVTLQLFPLELTEELARLDLVTLGSFTFQHEGAEVTHQHVTGVSPDLIEVVRAVPCPADACPCCGRKGCSH